MEERVNKIKKLWNDIHGDRDTIFYWIDDTETKYWYDDINDDIVSDNNFKVHISEKNIDNINKWYIIDLIQTLQGNIIQYYWKTFHKKIYYDD